MISNPVPYIIPTWLPLPAKDICELWAGSVSCLILIHLTLRHFSPLASSGSRHSDTSSVSPFSTLIKHSQRFATPLRSASKHFRFCHLTAVSLYVPFPFMPMFTSSLTASDSFSAAVRRRYSCVIWPPPSCMDSSGSYQIDRTAWKPPSSDTLRASKQPRWWPLFKATGELNVGEKDKKEWIENWTWTGPKHSLSSTPGSDIFSSSSASCFGWVELKGFFSHSHSN